MDNNAVQPALSDLTIEGSGPMPNYQISNGGPNATFDVRVLGIRCGNNLNELGFALVNYRFKSPNHLMRTEHLQSDVDVVPTATRASIIGMLHTARSDSSVASCLHESLGQMFLGGIEVFCAAHAIDLQSLHLIGIYAGILGYLPSPAEVVTAVKRPVWHTIITAATGVTTVSDFSVTELGWPKPHLSPMAFVHSVVYRHDTQTHAFLSIDEIASLTIIPPLTNEGARLAIPRSCGPGTMIIDYVMRYHALDKSHERRPVAQGKVNESIADQFLRMHDVCQTVPDLQMSFEMFGDHEGQRLVDDCSALDMTEMDTLTTIEDAIARNILRQYHRAQQHHSCAKYHIDKLYIQGTGAASSRLCERLKNELSKTVTVVLLNENRTSTSEMYRAFCYTRLALEATFIPALSHAARLNYGLSQKKAFITGKTIVWGNSWK